MTEYNSERFEFAVDGKKHSLPELTIDWFEEIANVYETQQGAGLVVAFRDFMVEHADDENTAAAIKAMGVRNVGKLFRDWTGSNSGEA